MTNGYAKLGKIFPPTLTFPLGRVFPEIFTLTKYRQFLIAHHGFHRRQGQNLAKLILMLIGRELMI